MVLSRGTTNNLSSGGLGLATIGGGNRDLANRQTGDYLLLCVKDGRYATAMEAMPVDGMKSDEELFQELRRRYRAKRSSILHLFALTKLRGIHFVKVSLTVPAGGRLHPG